jgi:poly(A) polymerase
MTAQQLAREIIDELRRRGHQAYLAGGCVRDMLLGREPKDYDVATDAQPEQNLAYFPKAIAVGAAFGVILVRKGGADVEVATFRADHHYRDGRRPERVTFTDSPEKDVQRRDFTINGLLFDPEKNECLDYVGGRDDLKARLIRAIGVASDRFAEDKLRMLRAVRFAARLGFEIEAETMRAIQQRAAEIHQVSAERIRDELNRILTEGGARRGFELLDETGLLKTILPEVAAMKGVAQPPEFHPEGDVWVHTLLMLEKTENPSVPLALGTLLHDVGKPATFQVLDRIRFNGHVEVGVRMAEEICKRLRYSTSETEQVMDLVANHMKFGHVQQMRQSTLKRFLRRPHFDEHMELHRLDCLSSHRNLQNYQFVREKLAETPAEALRPPRLLTGDDLIAAGYRPGPEFAKILADVEDAQLEERITTKEEALQYVRERDGAARGGRPENAVLQKDSEAQPASGDTVVSLFDDEG